MLYGLGETIHPTGQLKLPRDGHVVTLWNYDIASANAGINLYGSHPFYLQVDPDGSAAGVFLLNSNGMDVELQETKLTYRVIGGVLDLYFFLGPSPEAVIQQYQEVVGRPAMPPLWALGFHQCRWGYKTLSEAEQVVANYAAANIPLEVMWADIDYMYRFRDFTFDEERFNVEQLRSFVDRLHAADQHWVPITDCGIPHAPDDPAFTSGMEQGVFINDVTGHPYLGQVWPGPTHYPSFLAVNRSWGWWRQQLQHMWEQARAAGASVPYDGIWIDMNEASNFCEGEVCRLPASSAAVEARSATVATGMEADADGKGSSRPSAAAPAAFAGSGVAGWWRFSKPLHGWWLGEQALTLVRLALANCDLICTAPARDDKLSHPTYAINNLQQRTPLGSKTLPVTAKHPDGQLEYDAHNLYGLAEAAATFDALKQINGRRPFVLSRSTFAGSGRFAAHWTGDNAASWDDLRWSISGLLNSNMWGLALAGADICGFMGETSEELCARWIAAGAFYTFTRNHNAIDAPGQELYRWPLVAETARKALGMRYSLLPYLYTAFYHAHTQGGTVARPLFFAFAGDATAREVSEQWMLGDCILVSPVLREGARQVEAYFPAASWYSLWDNSHIPGPAFKTLDVPLTDVPVHVKGGSIIPLQQPAETTAAVHRSAVKLVVALDQVQYRQEQHLGSSNGGAATAAGGPVAPGADEAAGGASVGIGTTGDAAAHDSSNTDDPGSLASGMQLGCGMMYVDDGDSLQVPPVGSEASLLLFLSSMVVPDSLQGWLWGVPASADLVAEDQQTQAPPADAHNQGNGAATAQAHMAARPSDGSPGMMQRMFQRVFQHCKHHISQAHWTAAVGGTSAASAPAGVGAAATSDGSGGTGSKHHTNKALHLPYLAEIVILGVQPPADSKSYVVWVGEQQLVEAEQVRYNSSSQVLHVMLAAGQQPLAAQLTMSWQPAAAHSNSDGCCTAA
eukprot:gene12669-12796_t